jgi:hypothetical protein
MGQRVKRSPTITHTIDDEFRAQRAAGAAEAADPTDAGALTAVEAQLFEMVNDSPPLFRPWDGDQEVLAVARVWCGSCLQAGRRRGRAVAVAKAMDARHRGGAVVFSLLTQRPGAAPADPWPLVPVVLGVPGDDLGRMATPCPETALTWCRAHGRLVVKTDALLHEARRGLQGEIAGEHGRQGSVTAWPD